MANPHSLPFSPTAKQTQLPFSPSPSATSRFQLPPSPRQQTFVSSTPSGPHNRSESLVSKHSRSQRSGGAAVDLGSSTPAAGVLPSASFFHPSKPTISRPSSDDSSQDPESSQMVHESSLRSDVDSENLNRQMSTSKFSKRQKQSREPLLPIGGPVRRTTLTTPTSTPIRPSFSQDAMLSAGHSPTSSSRMKDSLERMFRKRFSVDSVIKSTSITGHNANRDSFAPADSLTTEGRMTFEMKPQDFSQVSSTISHGRKTSFSPVPTNSAPITHQSHSFIPTPPAGASNLAEVPVTDSKGRPVRRYTLHPSRNRFFFVGHLLTGGDSPWAFIASLIVVFGITGVYFGTTCIWWWRNESPAVAAVGAYMALLTISTMMATAFSDPGILPRDLDPDPPYPSTSPSDGGVKAPLPRDLKVRAGVVRVKYCPTCKTYRPPRSSHCKMCDNCVDGCDHHCQWVNNCVGRRNYASFFLFLLSGVLTLILIIVTSALHLYLLTVKERIDFRQALNHGVGSAVAFSLSIVVVWPVTALLVYHLRLLVLNATTIEQIRNQAHKSLGSGPPPPNPFSHGSWRHNLAYVLCRPVGYSWLDGASIATEDKRTVNPGLATKNDVDEKRG